VVVVVVVVAGGPLQMVRIGKLLVGCVRREGVMAGILVLVSRRRRKREGNNCQWS